jgi:pimeloyl-ACP methyl ester carboxylesterase
MAAQLPIVFLPGVMGSRLYFPASDRYWDPDSTWRMLRWAPIPLLRSDDDNRKEMHASQPANVVIDPLDDDDFDQEGVSLGWGGVVWSYYGDFLNSLRTLALNRKAFAVGYDWRQDIRWLGEFVADKLLAALEATGAAQIHVVTHSMGGLVARAAFLHNPDLVPKVANLVSICQPVVGAVILYRRLFTGLQRGPDGGGGVSDRAFRLILGNTRAAFVGNMSGQPGPLQLLPSEFFPKNAENLAWNDAIDAGTPPGAIYTSLNSPPGLNDPNLDLQADVRTDFKARVQDLMDFLTFLGPPSAPGPTIPPTWAICGAAKPTEVRTTFPAGSATPTVSPDGDTVVPLLSSQALPLPSDHVFVVQPLEHATACSDPNVIQLTQTILSPG